MRLLIATPLYPPEIGGPATYAKTLCEELPKCGTDSTGSPQVEVEVVKFSEVRHLPKIVRHYAYYRRVLAAARRCDVVLALDPVSVGWPALRAARRAGKPFVVKVVGDYAWEQGRQRFGVTQDLDTFVQTWRVPAFVTILRMLQKHVAKRSQRVIVPSEYLKKILIAWGVRAEHITVIYNAAFLEEHGTVPESVMALSRPIVVTAGRLVPWKNTEGVINAVVDIPELSLVVIGDGPERVALEAQAKQALGSRAVFTGVLSHADILATIKHANVFVLNSSYEGLSHLLVEATMLGVSVVATDVGGNGEVVTDGVSGTLVALGDTEALVKALHDRRMPAPGSVSQFTVDRMLTSTIELLKSL